MIRQPRTPSPAYEPLVAGRVSLVRLSMQDPSRSLKNLVAVVTGAVALPGDIGNGPAVAVLLAEAACSVICVDLKRT